MIQDEAWAVITDGKINTRTVSSSRVGAIVNWLLVDLDVMTTQEVTDEQIVDAWERLHGDAIVERVYVITQAQHDVLTATAHWMLKLRSLGYISSGHGRAIADQMLSALKADGISLEANKERDDRLMYRGTKP